MKALYELLGFSSPEEGVGLLFLLVIILFLICAAIVVIGIMYIKKSAHAHANTYGRRYSRWDIDRGSSGGLENRLLRLEDEQKYLTDNIDDIYRRLKPAYKKVGLVKYNAYSHIGGNISFAVVLLNSENSGVVLNVMNGREGSYTYMKEIRNGSCTERLGTEEQEALKMAMDKT